MLLPYKPKIATIPSSAVGISNRLNNNQTNLECTIMRNIFSSHLFSSLIGGIVGAAVVLFATGHMSAVFPTMGIAHAQYVPGGPASPPSGKFKELEVEKLIITGRAEFRNEEGAPEVVITDGSIISENTITARRLVGTQIQSHVIVGNRIFATPDNLFTTPMEQWRFFAEVGASAEAGGEVVVRCAGGGCSLVNGSPREGAFIRAGFDTENQPQIIPMRNSDRNLLPINYDLTEQQREMIQWSVLPPPVR